MGKHRALALGLWAAGLCLFTASYSSADGPAPDGSAGAPDACSEAVALLSGSAAGDHERHWQAIGGVVRKNKLYEIVDDMPRNVVGKVAFRQWEVRNAKGGAPTITYAAHCGHGGTCNQLAKEFREAYPQMSPAPVVHCGDVSAVLTNPSRGSL
jgi:hypothetical protein